MTEPPASPAPAPDAAPGPQPQPQPYPQGYAPGPQPHAFPPGPQPPPPAYRAPQPAPAPAPAAPGGFRRGFGLGAGAGLGAGLALLVLSIVGSLISGLVFLGMAGAATALAGSGQLGVQPLVTIWGEPTATKKLRAIHVTGAIMGASSDGSGLAVGTYGYEVADVLDSLDAGDADGVVLLLNTPGGSVTGSKAMADALDRYRERTGKMAFAFVEGMSASGGMYTMAGADRIVADHGSLVGSIGVIMGPFERYRDVVALDGGLLTGGVTTTGGITSEYLTAGTGKDAGNPFRDLTADERANLQAILDNEYVNFVAEVSEGRNIPAERITGELGASILDTRRAKEFGLIDDVLGRDAALRSFAEAAGLDPDDTRLVAPEPPSLLMQLLGAEGRVWGTAPAARPEGGQPARATSTLCTDNRLPLAYHGTLAGVCG